MNRSRVVFLAVALALLAAAAFAQGTPAPGFSVESTIFELSLFLPEGPGFAGPPRQSGDRRPPAGPGQGARQQSPALTQNRRPPSPERDPALFFAVGQVDRLLPIFAALRDNPYPTPANARKLIADIDAVLGKAQVAARNSFRSERQRFLESLPEEARHRTPDRQAEGSPGRQLTELQRRQRLIDNFLQMLQDRKKQLSVQGESR
jgi:hypothetical protein